MPIQTTPTTTATTPLSDDEILAHLHNEAGKRGASPRFVPGDAVEVNDQAVVDRCRLLRPFGIVVSFDPIDEIARVLVIDVNGHEMPLSLRGAQIAARS